MKKLYIMVLCSFFLSSKGFGQTSTNGGIYVTADLVAARGDISGLWTWSEANIICNELVDNDFSDWRLPSKEELNFLYGLHSHGSGNFKGMAYWSSTDVSSGYKATQFFHNGNASSGSLGGKYSVRCVRNASKSAAPTVTSTPPANSSLKTRESEILYLLINKDVAKAGLNAWIHYQTYGKNEGRFWPNLTKTNTPVNNKTNAQLYLLINKDVAKAGLNAWNHYQVYGKNEGRIWPNLIIVSDNNPTNCGISSAMYLLLNNDVAEAGLNAWSHYQSYGKNEGRIWPGCSSTL